MITHADHRHSRAIDYYLAERIFRAHRRQACEVGGFGSSRHVPEATPTRLTYTKRAMTLKFAVVADLSPARPTVDSTLGQRHRIEQAREFLAAQAGCIEGYVDNRSSLFVSLLGCCRADVVTDHGVECGDQDRVAIECFADIVFTHLESGDSLVGQCARRIGENLDGLQQVERDTFVHVHIENHVLQPRFIAS